MVAMYAKWIDDSVQCVIMLIYIRLWFRR